MEDMGIFDGLPDIRDSWKLKHGTSRPSGTTRKCVRNHLSSTCTLLYTIVHWSRLDFSLEAAHGQFVSKWAGKGLPSWDGTYILVFCWNRPHSTTKSGQNLRILKFGVDLTQFWGCTWPVWVQLGQNWVEYAWDIWRRRLEMEQAKKILGLNWYPFLHLVGLLKWNFLSISSLDSVRMIY